MKNEFYNKYVIKDVNYKEQKKKIIRENMDKPVHEIKKIIKQYYPDITNEEMIQLISEMNKKRRVKNIRKSKKKDKEER